MNIMNQFTLNASGKIVDKERLTHNQSFKWQSSLSVNKRVIRVRNDPNNAETQRNVGGDANQRNRLPVFTQFN
jgi:hypothetical protein